MGACMSSSNEEVDQKKKSQAIDKVLEEDSKRLRKECKILLLGKGALVAGGAFVIDLMINCDRRFWRERQVDDCQTDENHSLEGLLRR